MCYDGLPFDYEKKSRELASRIGLRESHGAMWLPTTGPEAWSTSELLHEAFDKITKHEGKRRRTDKIDAAIFHRLKSAVDSPTIRRVCTIADKNIAHAERTRDELESMPEITFNDIHDALRRLTQLANFISTTFFYDAAIGSVVPVPQFDVLEGLDSAWVKKSNLVKLNDYWHELSRSMDDWLSKDFESSFKPMRSRRGPSGRPA